MAYLYVPKVPQMEKVFQYRNAHLTRLDLEQMGYSKAMLLTDEQMEQLLRSATDKSYIDSEMNFADNMFVCPKNYDIWWHNIIAECNKLEM